MFEYLTLLRIVFSLSFGFIFLYVTRFITKVEKSKCPLSNSLYISNGKLLSSLLIIVGIINIVLPINKFVATIPVLGSSYVFLFIIILLILLIILKRIILNLKEAENKKCKLQNYKVLKKFINDTSINQIFIITIIISIIFFYL